MKQLISACLLVCANLAGAYASAQTLEATDAIARASIPGAPNSAAFMTLSNTSASDISLVSVKSDVAKRPELHGHINDNGVMRMRQRESIVIPAGGQVVLKPGGLHVMLLGLTDRLMPGGQVQLTLIDEAGQEYPVTAEVVDMRQHTGVSSKQGAMKGHNMKGHNH